MWHGHRSGIAGPHHRPLRCRLYVVVKGVVKGVVKVWHRRPSPPPFALQVIWFLHDFLFLLFLKPIHVWHSLPPCALQVWYDFVYDFLFLFLFETCTCMSGVAGTHHRPVRCRLYMILYMIFYMIFYFYFYFKPVHACLASPSLAGGVCVYVCVCVCVYAHRAPCALQVL